ncbi:MAG: LamG domain-containing protein [Candidatus Aenigmarchaeota archaeon]|nr:LamG domain-containing protein [Candidatus Aenigmarchaeota archaeon]
MAMKGLTPVVSVVLLLMIAIALFGSAYTYMTLSLGRYTYRSVDVAQAFCFSGTANIFLQNTGKAVIDIPQGVTIDPSLSLYYPLDTDTGSTVRDFGGYGNTGQFNGGAFVDGRVGKAASFDGSSSYIGIPPSPALNFSGACKFTEEAWINPAANNPGYRGFLGYEPGDSRYRMPSMWIVDTGDPDFGLYGGFGNGVQWLSFQVNGVIGRNKWTHVAVSFDGSKYTAYINGTKIFDAVGTWTGQCPNRDYAQLDAGRVDSYFNGYLDEVAVYSRVLPDSEILEHSNACAGSGNEYKCGDLTVTRLSGGGVFSPRFDRGSIQPSAFAIMQDFGCTGNCQYSIFPGIGVSARASVSC